MIDLHTHILPGIDDGSHDLAMTEAMLREEIRQGVDQIVATPHFYADRMSVESFLRRRGEAMEQTKGLLEREDLSVNLMAGSEVYYFQGMGKAQMLPRLCIEGTDFLLLEMPFEQWKEEDYRDVRDIIEKQKLSLILAHVERYIEFQKEKRWWDRIFELPVIPQINAGNFLRKGTLLRQNKKKKFCLQLVKEHERFLIGSDCHNMTGRGPNMGKAMEVLAREAGKDALTRAESTAREVLKPA